MGIVFRQSIKATIINFAGALLGALIVFISTKFLSPTQYGFNKNIINVGAVAQIFASLGTTITVYNFSQRYANEREKKKVLLTISFLTPIVVVLLLCIPYFIFERQFIDIYKVKDRFYVATFYLYVPLLVWLWSTITTLEQYMFSHVRVAVTSFFKEIVLRLLNILLLVLFIFHIINFYAFIVGVVLTYAVPVIGLSIVVARNHFGGLSFNWKVFSRAEYKEIINFSWYHLLVGISINLFGFVDSLMLAPYSGMSVVAVYNTAVYIATLLYLPYRAMSTASFATINQAFIDNDIPKMNDFFRRSAINILIAAMGMTAVVCVNLTNVERILPATYHGVGPIFIILAIGRVIDMATGLNNELMSITKYYRVSFRISIVLLVLLIGFYTLLIPRYGIYGAAWGSTMALIIFNILKMWFLWRKLHIQPFTSKTWLVVAAGAGAAAAGYCLPFILNPYIDTLIRTGVVLVIYLVLLIYTRPSADLTSYLNNLKTNKRLF